MPTNTQFSTLSLLRYLIGDKGVMTTLNRQEGDLLVRMTFEFEKNGLITCYTHCNQDDFTEATFKSLLVKIAPLLPKPYYFNTVLRYYHDANVTLMTDEMAQQKRQDILAAPVPHNQICVSKPVGVLWYQATETGVGVMKKTLKNSFALKFSKAVLAVADPDSFKWGGDEFKKASYTISSHDQLDKILAAFADSPSKTDQAGVQFFQEIARAYPKDDTNELCIMLWFVTKEPTPTKNDATEKVPYKQPEPTHFSLTELRKRNWNAKEIKIYLGEPDTFFWNKQNINRPIKAYEIARVVAVEKRFASSLKNKE